MMGFAALWSAVKHYHKLDNEEWLEKPPLLFRLTRPLMRVFALDASHYLLKRFPERYRKMQNQLHAAGLGYAVQAEEWWVLRILLFLILSLPVCLMMVKGNCFTVRSDVIWLILPFAGGCYPDLYIRDRVKKRMAEIEKNFPFFIELLVMAVRSGLNFSAALVEAGGRMPKGATQEEIEKVLREIRTGKSRKQALVAFSERITLSVVASFVSSVNQAEETGGEITAVLAIQAEQSRTERFLRAEKRANQAPVKMLLPLVAGMFPVTFIMIGFLVFVKLRETGVIAQLVGG
jgi:tight adherence protein C